MATECGADKFQCPHCRVVATQKWFSAKIAAGISTNILNHLFLNYRAEVAVYPAREISKFLQSVETDYIGFYNKFVPENFSVATCISCFQNTLWMDTDLVYPKSTNLPPANADLDNDIKDLYMEAASILVDSPKGAAALLRLALQKLLKQVGKTGKNINNDIKELVTEGLSIKIQQALDALRFVGNEAVHPGVIDFDDNADIARKLFDDLNFIADELITKPKDLAEFYEHIVPDETKGHIATRDSSSKKPA